MSGIIEIIKRAVAPNAPASGEVAIWVGTDNEPRITNESGVTSTFKSRFGQNNGFIRREGQDTQNTSSWKTYSSSTFTIDNSAGDDFRICANGLWRYSTGTRNINIRLLVNGSVVAMGENIAVEPKDSGGDIRIPFEIKDYLVLNDGSNTLELQFQPQQNGDTAYLYFGLIEYWRV